LYTPWEVETGQEECMDLGWFERATYTQLRIRTRIDASQRRSNVAGVVIYGCHIEFELADSTVICLAQQRPVLLKYEA
jgi:hypothetical protein